MVKGLQQTQVNLNRITLKVSGNVCRESITKGLLVIGREARRIAPVDTGYMRDHIQEKDITNKSGVLESSAEYSIFQEYGTSKMRAQPFMRPALKNSEAQLINIFADKLRSEL